MNIENTNTKKKHYTHRPRLMESTFWAKEHSEQVSSKNHRSVTEVVHVAETK
jgi:hypothetical protein